MALDIYLARAGSEAGKAQAILSWEWLHGHLASAGSKPDAIRSKIILKFLKTRLVPAFNAKHNNLPRSATDIWYMQKHIPKSLGANYKSLFLK